MEYILMVYNRFIFFFRIFGFFYTLFYLIISASVYFCHEGKIENIEPEHKKLIKYGFFVLIGTIVAIILLP